MTDLLDFFIKRFKIHFLKYQEILRKEKKKTTIKYLKIGKQLIPNGFYTHLILDIPFNSYNLLIYSIPENPLIEIYFNILTLPKKLKIFKYNEIDNLALSMVIHEVGHLLSNEIEILKSVTFWIGMNYPHHIQNYQENNLEFIMYSIKEMIAETYLFNNHKQLDEPLIERKTDFLEGINDLKIDNHYTEEALNKSIRMATVNILFYLTKKWHIITNICEKNNLLKLNDFMNSYLKTLKEIYEILSSQKQVESKRELCELCGNKIVDLINNNNKIDFISIIYPK